MSIPNDPVMLLSFVNIQLRDHYSSFSDFCKTNSLDKKLITDKLASIDYQYNETTNQFI